MGCGGFRRQPPIGVRNRPRCRQVTRGWQLFSDTLDVVVSYYMSGKYSPSEDPKTWSTLRERTVFEESKRVMEAQKADIDDLDDKALRTVRISAVLVTVGATGIEIIGLEGINVDLAIVSTVSFILTLVFGVIVYNESDELVGPKSEYLRKMRENSMTEDWDEDFLYQMEHWIDENQSIVEFNGYLLIICQTFFVFAVAAGVSSLLGLTWLQFALGGIVLVLLVYVTLRLLKLVISGTK